MARSRAGRRCATSVARCSPAGRITVAEPTPRPARRLGEGQSALASAIGPQLLIRIGALARTARTYDVTNQAFQRQLQDALTVVQKVLDAEQELALAASAGY